MPWFVEEDNKHPAVYFPIPEDFWRWRNDHRPRDGINGEIWDRARDDHQFDDAVLAPLQNGGAMVVEPVEGFVVEVDVMPAHEHQLHFLQADRFYVPKEREWKDLPILTRIKYLADQEDAPIEFRQVLDYLEQVRKDNDYRWQEGYNVGYEDGKDEIRNRDDD